MASCSNIRSLSINISILAQPSAAPPDCKKTSVWALALKCMSTVIKIGALDKMYGYSPEKKALMGKCTGTIQKMGPCILKKGRNPEKCTGTVTKMGAAMENVPVQFFIKYKNIGYHNCLPEYENKPQPSAAIFFLLKNIFILFFFSFFC